MIAANSNDTGICEAFLHGNVLLFGVDADMMAEEALHRTYRYAGAARFAGKDQIKAGNYTVGTTSELDINELQTQSAICRRLLELGRIKVQLSL